MYVNKSEGMTAAGCPPLFPTSRGANGGANGAQMGRKKGKMGPKWGTRRVKWGANGCNGAQKRTMGRKWVQTGAMGRKRGQWGANWCNRAQKGAKWGVVLLIKP